MGFSIFRDSIWQLVREWKFQLWVYSECLATPFTNYSRVDLQSWKTLRKFVTWDFGDLLATHSNREKHVFCTNGVKSKIVFKNLLVFPRITCYFIVLSTSPSSKTTIFTHKTSIFFINPSPIFKKMYGFSLILKVFHVSSLRFLGFCVFVEIWKYDVRIWFIDVLLSLMYEFFFFFLVLLV